MVVISGRSRRYSRGMIGMVACSHAYPACYVARFIRVLDQCNTASPVRTYRGCRRRLVVDIIDCICSRNAPFEFMSACPHFLKVPPLYFPADYTSRWTGVDAAMAAASFKVLGHCRCKRELRQRLFRWEIMFLTTIHGIRHHDDIILM